MRRGAETLKFLELCSHNWMWKNPFLKSQVSEAKSVLDSEISSAMFVSTVVAYGFRGRVLSNNGTADNKMQTVFENHQVEGRVKGLRD